MSEQGQHELIPQTNEDAIESEEIGEEESKQTRVRNNVWKYVFPQNPRAIDYLSHPFKSFGYYLYNLADTFGWKFVFMCCSVYGFSQGFGNEWGEFAGKFYLADTMGLPPARMAAIRGFTMFPWQIKAVYGMISDMIPIWGWHKAPYAIIPGCAGIFAFVMLALVSANEAIVGILMILANYSIASPDVVIDAAVAERAKTHPRLAPDLQALCWGSLGIGGLMAAVSVGFMQESLGSRGIFGLCALTGVAVSVPAMLGFLKEKREPPSRRGKTCENIKKGFADPVGKWVFYLAIIVTFVSIFLGLLAVFETSENSVVINGTITIFCAVFVVAPCQWFFLGKISKVLAKASMFIFLRDALQPTTTVLFYWYHSTEENCKRDYPCLSPEFLGWMEAAGYGFLFVGTVVYQRYFSQWSYRSIFTLAQVLLVFFNMMDLLWVTRVNVKMGIPDEVFIFGEELIGPIIRRLAQMPMLILAARLCPPGVEATLFALNMGLSNFGVTIGDYLGQALLGALGGVEPPEFKNLEVYVVIRSLCRLLPILLVWPLVPKGSPFSDALEMAAEEKKRLEAVEMDEKLTLQESTNDAKITEDSKFVSSGRHGESAALGGATHVIGDDDEDLDEFGDLDQYGDSEILADRGETNI
mmetsp:Transcript_20028/g.29994  ORF Transcript_20028/g.29994 Transcript_20028/m.29994 type:complete len:640 (+) Transcript_20028:70-1989(+)|eukprot:CAMPEP_0167746460 /NCGR_PEP_ID=MMETSP0110_2-20121227/3724_1 /TAXON_ID=629695 /ORGANISM="Gymnochlora sp., Strain CCMP2014" /LENGTH=639 /DNA_ID=CAMNT_0007631225 /DNA_START=22 /DNA_END=1941 /DNA_ORIENTATION=-